MLITGLFILALELFFDEGAIDGFTFLIKKTFFVKYYVNKTEKSESKDPYLLADAISFILYILMLIFVVAGWFFVLYIESEYIESVVFHVVLFILTTVVAIVILLLMIVFAIVKPSFNSIDEEVEFCKNNNILVHSVLEILEIDDRNIFVIAKYLNNHRIIPALFTKSHGKINLMDVLDRTITYYPIDIEDNKSVKISCVTNLLTKSSMLIVTSREDILCYRRNSLIPLIRRCDSKWKVNIYGMIINEKNINIDEICINSKSYKLIENKKQYINIFS